MKIWRSSYKYNNLRRTGMKSVGASLRKSGSVWELDFHAYFASLTIPLYNNILLQLFKMVWGGDAPSSCTPVYMVISKHSNFQNILFEMETLHEKNFLMNYSHFEYST